ncbi:ATP-binding protein [Vibrio sp. HA2012]|nr:ATP-binding protein [Vibrio sp. HA2012]
MKETNLRSRQKGAFAIEFAVVGLLLGVLLAFAQDAIIKISMKGKLDRLSYSAVSIVKERTQLYSNEDQMTDGDVDLVYTAVSDSLSRTTGTFEASRFGMHLEEQTYDDSIDDTTVNANTLQIFDRGQTCTVSPTLSQKENALRITTTLGYNSPLYRVTLCYETDNLVMGLLDNGFTTVSSTSVALGR